MSTSIATEFSPFEYLLIGTANAFGEDKLLFEERIEWVLKNARNLHKMLDQAEDKPMAQRCLIELNNIRKGINTGFMMGLDGTASGLQCLGTLSGCIATAMNVGLIDPNKRCDVYTATVGNINYYLNPSRHIQLKASDNYDGLTRNDIKPAVMTRYYNSKAVPARVFGEGTLELAAFYKALKRMNPGAEDLMEAFCDAINNNPVAKGGRLNYNCYMPDGFFVNCNVIAKREESIEIDELDNGNGNHATVTHQFQEIGTNPMYVAVPANFTHATDGFIVREMHRRMNYDAAKLAQAYEEVRGAKVTNRSDMMSLRAVDLVLSGNVGSMTENDAGQLAELIEKVTQFEAAPLVTIHDEFKTYPAHCGQMRYHYRELFAEMAESDLATKMLQGIYEDNTLWYAKRSEGSELADLIRKSRYAIC